MEEKGEQFEEEEERDEEKEEKNSNRSSYDESGNGPLSEQLASIQRDDKDFSFTRIVGHKNPSTTLSLSFANVICGPSLQGTTGSHPPFLRKGTHAANALSHPTTFS